MSSVNALLLERVFWVDGRCETCGDCISDCACEDRPRCGCGATEKTDCECPRLGDDQ